MPTTSAFSGSIIGPPPSTMSAMISGATTYAMATLNTGWAVRFTAHDARDIATVYLNWSSVTAAGQVTLRVETIDATTGLPSGTLYDANATLAQAPVAGWQAFTFATLPTTGLTGGTEFAIVALTTTGGTTMTLRSHVSTGNTTAGYPTIVLTAANGTTRSNFAEVNGSLPIITIVYEDGSEEVLETAGLGAATTGTALDIYGTKAAGMKFIVPTNETWSIEGIQTCGLAKTGAPNDLRVRILNSSDSTVSGTTRTVDKDSLNNITSNRRLEIQFAAPVSLTADTYRVIFDDSAGTGTNTNKYTLQIMTLRSSAVCPASISSTTTGDITAVPIVWTDTQASINATSLLFATASASGGSSGILYTPGMSGGMES